MTKRNNLLIARCTLLTAIAAGLAGRADAAAVTRLNYADYGNENLAPTRLDVAGVSQDGTTVVGTIRLGNGGDFNRAFYYRDGQLHTLDGLGLSTTVAGIAADGRTLLANAVDPESTKSRVMYVTGLGTATQSTQYVGPTGTFTATVARGSPFSGTSSYFAPLSADGKTVALSQNSSATKNGQYLWTATGGLTSVPGATGNASFATPVALSANGSVVAGSNGSTTTYIERGGVIKTLYKGVNNGGTTRVFTVRAISADGNTVIADGGLWRDNVAGLTNFQNYQALPGYTAIAGVDPSNALTYASVDAGTLKPTAITPDAAWVVGGPSGAGDANGGIGNTGWIWSAATNTTYEITQFLAAHGVDGATIFPNGTTVQPLYAVTGIALNGDRLTLAGIGNPDNDANGWLVTVTVPEPTTTLAATIAAVVALRRRRARNAS